MTGNWPWQFQPGPFPFPNYLGVFDVHAELMDDKVQL
jgi:hypothetical protein